MKTLLVFFLSVFLTGNFIHAQWSVLNQTFPNQKVRSIVPLGNDLYVGTFSQHPGYGKMYRSSDNGVTWVVLDSIQGDGYFHFLKSNNAIFATNQSSVLKSVDNGVTFNPVATTGSASRIALINSKLVVSTSKGAILRSSDNGITWQSIKAQTTLFYPNNLDVINNMLFLTSSGLFASSDEGTTWSSKPPMQNKLIYSLFANGPALFVSIFDTIMRSLDNGGTWTNITGNLVSLGPYFDFSFGKYNSRTLVGTPGGLYVSNNYGQNWQRANTGIGRAQIYNMTAKDNFVFAASLGRIYRIDTSQILTLPCDFVSTIITKIKTPSCLTCSDGSAVIVPLSGTGPYNYTFTASNFSQNSATVTGLADAQYTYCVTDITGCGVCDTISILYNKSVSLSDNHYADAIKIYPSPASEEITVLSEMDSPFTQIKMFTINGTVMYISGIVDTKKLLIDLKKIPPGVYFLEISQGEFTHRKKMIKY